jgi:hypothetical protein
MLLVRRVLPGIAVAVLLGGCFDFDATVAGGPLGDSGAGTNPGLDASFPDASGPVDAGGGAGDGGTPVSFTDGGSYCASLTPPGGGIFFCDDFDEHPLPGSWGTYKESEGALNETNAAARSLPNSVDETTIALVASSPLPNVALRTPLGIPSVPATLLFAFSVEPVEIDAAENAAIVLAAVDFLDADGNRYSVELAISVQSGAPAMTLGEQSGLLDGSAPYTSHPLSPTEPLAMNAWNDLVIEIDWTAATTAEGKVSVGGAQAIDVPLTMTVQPASLQIGIGTSYVSQPSPGWELRYDNVSFSAH